MLEIIVILLIVIVALMILNWFVFPVIGDIFKGFFEVGAWAVKKSRENEERLMPRPQQEGERSISEVVEKRRAEKAALDERWRAAKRKRMAEK